MSNRRKKCIRAHGREHESSSQVFNDRRDIIITLCKCNNKLRKNLKQPGRDTILIETTTTTATTTTTTTTTTITITTTATITTTTIITFITTITTSTIITTNYHYYYYCY